MEVAVPQALKTKSNWRDFFLVNQNNGFTRDQLVEALDKAGVRGPAGEKYTRSQLNRLALWSGARMRKVRSDAKNVVGPKRKYKKRKAKAAQPSKAEPDFVDLITDIITSNIAKGTQRRLVKALAKEFV